MRILIVGFGDVAARLAPLLAKRFRLYGLIRDPIKADLLRALGVVPVIGDLDDRVTLKRATALADCVIHLAPPPAEGLRDTRTRNLLAALSRPRLRCEYSHAAPARRLVYISTTGVYGDCGGDWVTETRPVHPINARARRRVDAETSLRRWVRAAPASRSLSVLRAPGIYAKDRLPLARLRAGTPALHAEEDSFSNHIHADDLARAIVAALFQGFNGRVYHCSDDAPQKMGDYFDQVADSFGLPRPRRITREEAERTLSAALLSFLRESRRLSNQRLREELNVPLTYPTVAAMLASLSAADKAEVLSARADIRPR